MPSRDASPGPVVIATSLKMYFDHQQTLEWARGVREIALRSKQVQSGKAQLLVFPSFPSIKAVIDIFKDVPVLVGAQNVAAQNTGAYTGEVSVNTLKQVGCRVIEIGHAERRHIFGERLDEIKKKVALTIESGLTPLVCVGEKKHESSAEAAAVCIDFIRQVTPKKSDGSARMIFAYEPEWAIGAEKPADSQYVREVCEELRAWINSQPELSGSAVIYGGSAGPGLLTSLNGAVDGLFLGRFAHDPDAINDVLSEVS